MFDELPIELVYHILELAARLEQVDAHAWVATSLTLVSREVHKLIIPTIYHTVLLDDRSAMMLSADSFNPPPYIRHARCLMLKGSFSVGVTVSLHPQLLTFFPGVDTFALDYDGLHWLEGVDDFCPERLMYLSGGWYELFTATADSPRTLRNLTHLRVTRFQYGAAARLYQLPRLTHLFVEHTVFWNDSEGLRASMTSILNLPRLKRIVFRLYHSRLRRIDFEDTLASLRALQDPRVYLDPVPTGQTTPLGTGLWEMFKACASEVRAGVDVWETGIPLYPGDSDSNSGSAC